MEMKNGVFFFFLEEEDGEDFSVFENQICKILQRRFKEEEREGGGVHCDVVWHWFVIKFWADSWVFSNFACCFFIKPSLENKK